MMKHFLSLLMVVSFIATLPAQNVMQVKRVGAAGSAISLDSIKKITFTGTDSMLVQTSKLFVSLNEISKIYFADIPQSIQQVTPSLKSVDGAISFAFTAKNTSVQFSLKEPTVSQVAVCNLEGKLVKMLASGTLGSGHYTFVWNKDNSSGCKVPTGMYILHVTLNNQQFNSKQIVLK
jgi:hypothetical protein